MYNLKRRIAELPSLSLDSFTERVAGGQEISSSKTDIHPQRQKECVHCDRTCRDLKLYQKHLKSWPHIQRVEESESGKDAAPAAADALPETTLLTENQSDSEGGSVATVAEQFDPFSCLFCIHGHATLDDNLQHMQQDHGMFIPDREHLVHLETFIGYLFTIVTEFNECLYCGHVKSTSEATRQHMLNKGHCKLRTREGPEYEEFYDESSDGDRDAYVLKDKKIRSAEVAKLLDSNKEHEVVLPSGRTIGDRFQTSSSSSSSRPTFRSHTKPADSRVAVSASGDDSTNASAEARRDPHARQLVTRADGGLGMIGVSDLQKRALRAVEKKMLKTEIRARKQYRAVVEKSANKTMQKHFKVRKKSEDAFGSGQGD